MILHRCQELRVLRWYGICLPYDGGSSGREWVNFGEDFSLRHSREGKNTGEKCANCVRVCVLNG